MFVINKDMQFDAVQSPGSAYTQATAIRLSAPSLQKAAITLAGAWWPPMGPGRRKQERRCRVRAAHSILRFRRERRRWSASAARQLGIGNTVGGNAPGGAGRRRHRCTARAWASARRSRSMYRDAGRRFGGGGRFGGRFARGAFDLWPWRVNFLVPRRRTGDGDGHARRCEWNGAGRACGSGVIYPGRYDRGGGDRGALLAGWRGPGTGPGVGLHERHVQGCAHRVGWPVERTFTYTGTGIRGGSRVTAALAG